MLVIQSSCTGNKETLVKANALLVLDSSDEALYSNESGKHASGTRVKHVQIQCTTNMHVPVYASMVLHLMSKPNCILLPRGFAYSQRQRNDMK